mmetsp:Transcript_44730/g.89740  ORF Transcript_44730/g.89740 Transcript_44730/m.89740 type:complete len:86 (+) Transcript_44730:154-411(+)
MRRACSFCAYANVEGARALVYRDDKVVAFESANPRAIQHLLVIPKEHYGTVAGLSVDDVPLLRHMLQVGRALLQPPGGVNLFSSD